MSLSLGIYQTSLLLPEAGLNSNPVSYQSDEQGSQVGSLTFHVSLCNQNSSPRFARREAPFPQINTSSGTWQGWPSQQAGDTESATRRWKPALNPKQAPRNVVGWLREMGHQSLQEASLLSKLAVTQWTLVQRVSPGNKDGFPYLLFRVSQFGGYSLSHK
jgi:hypothetical protein